MFTGAVCLRLQTRAGRARVDFFGQRRAAAPGRRRAHGKGFVPVLQPGILCGRAGAAARAGHINGAKKHAGSFEKLLDKLWKIG